MGKATSANGLVTVRVPGSTSNLGAGFDCFGLALQIYLTVQAHLGSDPSVPCKVINRGEGADELPEGAENLVFRAMRFVAERERIILPPLELTVDNELPLGRGLGSSAAAIIAGITLTRLIGNCELSDRKILRYALELEGHADNVAAAFYGGLIISCVKDDGEVLLGRREWPSLIKVVAVSPDVQLKTSEARLVLNESVKRSDAVFNLQRTALFLSALANNDYDLLWEAMQDRLHQAQRQTLVPGLREALATTKRPGLLGVALSGAGPTVIALTVDRSKEIGDEIAANFRSRGIAATVRVLEVDLDGCKEFDKLQPSDKI